jgi:two-component system nitrogen regulation sensor histidine kinase NtrY
MRFQTKLMLAFATLFGVSAGMMFYFAWDSQMHMVARIEDDLRTVIGTVHFSTERLSSEKARDQVALKDFIEQARRNGRVREVSIVNSQHHVVASSNPRKVGKYHSITGQEVVVREEFGEEDSAGRHNRYTVNIPIERDGNTIGMVQTSLVLNDFNMYLRTFSIKTAIVAAALFLLLCGLSYLVLWRLNRPLRLLTGAARGAAEGDLTMRLPPAGHDELGVLTETFNSMLERLAEQKRMEEKMGALERQGIVAETAAMLSHEIRNPLNLINLTADHLAASFPARIPQEAHRQELHNLLGELKAQVRQLNNMVSEILTVGKPVKLNKTDVALSDLLEQVSTLVRQHLFEKEIALHIDAGAIVLRADPEQMRLVFLNLLVNAIAAVDNGGLIAVSAEELPGLVQIAVCDDGGGISPQDIERVFEPYFSRRPGGTGLGLALVRRIIEQHGGSVKVAGRPEGGTRFDITLPKEQ